MQNNDINILDKRLRGQNVSRFRLYVRMLPIMYYTDCNY